MRVESSLLSYQTAHQLTSATRISDATITPPSTDTVSLSPLAASSTPTDFEDLDPKQQLALLILQALLGQRVSRSHAPATRPSTNPNTAAPVAVQIHRRTEVHAEAEQMSFQAQGAVQTADGRSITFSASLSMHREFYSRVTTNSTSAPNTTDPLILNLSGAPPRLTNAKIAFDLNSDGTPDQISFLAPGSGFLVLDANADGVVNNGSELFGPQTGNGFAELAAYDSDANGWIDEADPVFAKLQIWTQSGLASLAESGVGAISTISAETPFAIKDAANNTQGEIRATGVYLTENGGAGTIQHLDLTT
ncbi:MAG: hypothetical protein U0R19_14150 [Bryobacteraceae bacterium]